MQSSNRTMPRGNYVATMLFAWALAPGVSVITIFATAADAAADPQVAAKTTPPDRIHLDRSGHTQVGKASFYAAHYSGKTMADGTPMRLYSDNAASITLPLGTTAKVTNLETGRSALVTIRDRGPYVTGRIVDLSPGTARKIGLGRKQGLARVQVAPVTIPQVDGSVKVMPDGVALASNQSH